MIKHIKLPLIIMLLLTTIAGWAQHKPESAGKLVDGNFVLIVDLGWNTKDQLTFSKLYDVDSITVKHLFSKDFDYFGASKSWKLEFLGTNLVRLSTKLQAGDASGSLSRNQIISETIEETNRKAQAITYPLEAVFGSNYFTDAETFTYENGQATFFLRGFKDARKVQIAGSFNSWSTMSTPLTRHNDGWRVRLELPPGKHTYKFIVDGKWLPDPSNRQKEEDGHFHFNSVVFCPNYVFLLNAFPQAKKVVLSGSFNGWNERKLRMVKTEKGWQLPVYVKDGTYTYKFIVDGNWINDPANPNLRADGNGNENSVIAFGDTFNFLLKGFDNAREIKIAGSFNEWNPNELFMTKTKKGWEFSYHLAAGLYEYKLIVDGQWMPDPTNPLYVGHNEFKNSFFVFKPNFTFRYKASTEVKEVRVTGSFNNWDEEGYPLQLVEDEWILPYFLHPGRHTYKLIVNGQWILDPANQLWEENQYGTGNSVIWIDKL